MRPFLLITALVFLIACGVASADGPEDARVFFKKIADRELIIDDVSSLSPQERREMIEITHNLCRYGKALRLEKSREYQSLILSKQATLAQDQWDALYYELNFGIDFSTELINGYVQVQAASLISGLSFIELDLFDNMIVDSAVMNGTQLTFTHTDDLLTITLDDSYDVSEVFSVFVYYKGHPVEGGFQAFEFSTHGGINMATTLSEPYFARTWWPCKDYPDDKADSVDIIITHPDNFVCASNGLVEAITDNGNGTKTTHWSHNYPIATYLVAIGVTNYVKFGEWYYAESGDSMPVDFYVYPEKLSTATVSYPITAEMVDTLSSIFGEYPFVNEKYGMLQFGWGGAMEHQTNTSMNSEAYYQSIIVHELGHQWWGDMITCENWHEIWMNEGFATYTEALWFEAMLGEDYYHSYMNDMAYYNGGTIWCQDTTSVWAIFSSRVYDKGAWVLHMLRHWVGDSLFFQILNDYYDDPRYKWKTINTEQFRDLCIEVSGDSRLTDFFQDWIWGEYYPKYKYSYSYEEYQPGDYVIYLNVRQIQTSTPLVFDMPIDIRFNDGSQYYDLEIYNNMREQDYIIFLDDLAGDPVAIRFDEDSCILREASMEGFAYHLIYDPLDTALQYAAYEDSVIVKGGLTPYMYYKVGGTLPAGLSLNLNTGKITGTPTESGEFTFKVRVEDTSYPTKSDTLTYALSVAEKELIIGDANFDGYVNVSDAVWIINYVFVGGQPPQPVMDVGDANCDTSVNVSDAVWIINYVFVGGPAPGYC